jgi:hypothetical protein
MDPSSTVTENSIFPLHTKHQSGVVPGVDLGSRRHPGLPTSRSLMSFVDGCPPEGTLGSTFR